MSKTVCGRPRRRAPLLLAALMIAAALITGTASAVAGTPPRSSNPFASATLFVDPSSDAAQQASAWADSRPRDAAEMAKIARQPWAEWYGDWVPDAGALFRQRVQERYAPAHAWAFIAVYDLPHRDCSGRFSAGGAPSAGAYEAWIRNLAASIGSYPTIVIVEPDGVPDTPCLGSLAAERLGLISFATRTLAALPNTSVYIDAGRSDWLPASKTIELLRRAGIQYARGFALDTTGYDWTGDELRYGDQIGRALGGKHFIINTSRNGRGPLPRNQAHDTQDTWCNTPGRGLGSAPTTNTGDPLADAFEWILHPGYSDGACHGGPRAGTWWPQYALALARNAGW